ncbi:MAG: HAMP domain-containing histidine kinase, partial [Verrucomicrobiaceae bacterium]
MLFEESAVYQGTLRTFVSVKFPIRDSNGVIQALGGVSTDISERKRSEQEIQAAREAAERASHAKDRFLAILSHELRTPLTPVLVAVTEALSSDLPEELRTTLEMIQRNIELESRLIEDLLDLTRLVRGKMKLQFKTVDTHELVQQAVAICAPSLAVKQQHVRFELNATKTHVRGDPARLQQVFWNLLQNAIKFSPEHSEITFRSCNTGDQSLVIECIDHGMGMERDALTQIFRPFEQVESSMSNHHSGLGLGLAISRMIIDAHGGSISADSLGPGKGSVFTMRVPSVAAPEIETQRPEQEVAPGHAERLRILVVEDS